MRGGRLVVEQARAEDADGGDARVPDLGVGLDAAAAEASGHDLGGVDVGVGALAGVGDGPVDRVRHHLGRRRPLLARAARRDGQVAVRRDLLQQLLVAAAVGAARAVAPHQHRQLGVAGLAGHVDCVLLQAALGLVGL